MAGEGITVNYLSDVEAFLHREMRGRMLESAWGFSCSCNACEPLTPFGIVSERRRVVAAGLREGFRTCKKR